MVVLQKENLGSASRGRMGLKSAPPRRNVLSAINNGGEPAPSEVGSETAGPEFGGRDDVEQLLAEKMKGKSKTDYKVPHAAFLLLVLGWIQSCHGAAFLESRSRIVCRGGRSR